MTAPLTINETFKRLTLLLILVQNRSGNNSAPQDVVHLPLPPISWVLGLCQYLSGDDSAQHRHVRGFSDSTGGPCGGRSLGHGRTSALTK